MKYIVALGANLGSREETLRKAVGLIAQDGSQIIKTSRFIETEALVLPGAEKQPNYINAIAIAESNRAPVDMLDFLLGLETKLGRTRIAGERWAPRFIDLDIIGIEQTILENPRLTIPHPQMHVRRFVLEPLCEVWPEWHHPKLNLKAFELLSRLK